MPQSDTLEKARRVFAKNRGVLRTSEARRLGIHPRTLYALRDQGDIEQVALGLYRLADAPPLSAPDLVAVAHRAPRAVVCLVSALSHYELTTQIPRSVHLAIRIHSQAPRIDRIPIKVFWFSESSFSAGVVPATVDGFEVRMYSPEKSIADAFKYRNKLGLDLAIEALRTYREKMRRPDFRALSEFTRINRVQKVMKPYLEAIL